MVKFTCNVCGAACAVANRAAFSRETASCDRCGSTPRFRWIVHALSRELFGQSLTLRQFPTARHIRGAGMSEWTTISEMLAEKLDYTNTFYHQEPRLDILHPAPSDLRRYDFVISTEVFEHIPAPVQVAFNNLAAILRPNGFAVFSVPWMPSGHTEEHFGTLHDWRVEDRDGRQVLVNQTPAGSVQTYENLVYHGGPGQTLEMRVFSIGDLLNNFRNAGFAEVSVAEEEEDPAHGILFEPWSRGLVARMSPSRR